LTQYATQGKICQIAAKLPYGHRINQMAIKSTKWPLSIPNRHRIFQIFLFQGPTKYTQIGIFGLNIYKLATLKIGVDVVKNTNAKFSRLFDFPIISMLRHFDFLKTFI
jgi:hypothetical protein